MSNLSVKEINGIILKILKEAGPIGLHINDLVKEITLPLEKKQVIMRLNDLLVRDKVKKVCVDFWKVKDPENARPTINLPGERKFSSYKNSLQEYCQKLKKPVPQYKVTWDITGYLAEVTFNDITCTTDESWDNTKDAEQHAAFLGLKKLNYIMESEDFADFLQGGQKRLSNDSKETPPAKYLCTTTIINQTNQSSKSQLNELAQKNKLDTPQYKTIQNSDGFHCTVTFNGREFQGSKPTARKKEAEKYAAEVALNFLTNPAAEALKEGDYVSDIKEMVKSARAETNGFPDKSRLQEYCQQTAKTLPKYDTDSGIDRHISTVTIEGVKYQGKESRSKKEAERSAAEQALIGLGLKKEGK